MASDGGSGKQVKFSFAIDNSSVQSVMRSLRDLTAQAEKFAKAMQGVGSAMTGGFFSGGVGGKAPTPGQATAKMSGAAKVGGTSAISNVVLENAKAFRSMATMGGDALKSMQDVLKKSVDDQKRSLTDLDRTIEKLGQRYQELKRAQQGAVGAARGTIGGAMTTTGAELAQAQSARVSAAANLAQTQAMAPQRGLGAIGAGYRQGGILGALNANLGGPGLGTGMVGGILSGMGLGGLAGMAGPAALGYLGKAAFDETRVGSRMLTDQMALRGMTVNPVISQLRRGDTSFLAKQRYLAQDPTMRKELEEQIRGMGAGAEAFLGSGGSVFDKISRAATLGFDKVSGGEALDPKTQTALLQAYMGQVEKAGQMTGFQQNQGAFMDMMASTMGSRIAVAHGGGPRLGQKPTGAFVDPFMMRSAALTERGFSIEQEHAARMQMLGAAGEEGRRYGGAAMSAAAGGYGAYGGLLAQSIQRGQGERLARLAIGGGIDRTAGMGFGAAMMAMNPLATTDVSGTLIAAQQSGAFGRGGMDFTTAARMQAGIGELNAITQGSTGYQKGANLLSAIKTLGPGASYRAQDFLSSMSAQDMINTIKTGQVSEKAGMMGITAENVRSQFESTLQSAALQNVDDKATDPMSRALRGWRESGKTITERIKELGPGSQEARTLLMAAQDAAGMSEGASLGVAALMPGIIGAPGAGKLGSVGAGKLDPVTAARLKTQADEQRRMAGLSTVFAGEDIAEQAAAPAAAKGFQAAGENLSTTAEAVAGKLETLGAAVDKAAANMAKLMDPKDRAAFLSNELAGDPNGKKGSGVSFKFGPKGELITVKPGGK